MEFVLLFVGLALIIKSADVLIDSTSKIARKFGVSTFVIGITVIAFGTSAPELAVGVISGFNKANELTLGNVVGSAVSNLALIVGMSAMIFPLAVKDTVVKREIPMLIAVEGVLAFMVLYDNKLTRLEGAILLAGFAGFIFYVIRSAKKSMKISIDAEGDLDTDGDGNQVADENIKQPSLLKLSLFSAVSLAGLFIGGSLTVSNSTKIAEKLGLSETVIGLTVVAIATTLPELITSLMAVKKKEPDIVLGNCVGSNLFNILLVLGASLVIHPITIQVNMAFDIGVAVLLTVAVFFVSLFSKRLSRSFGILFMIGYFVYLFFKVLTAFRGS